MRIFFGLTLDSKVQQAAMAIVKHLQKQWPHEKISWQIPEKLHITVRFIESVPEDKLKQLIESLKPIFTATQAFSLPLGKIDFLPSRHPKTIMLAVKLTLELAELFRKIEESVVALELPAETRSYLPHITLGKIRTRTSTIKAPLSLPNSIGIIPIPKNLAVTGISLFQSVTKPEGSVYQILECFSFATNK
jgi:2'-5' RNA ligase